ncbi:MAG: DUF1232 domain-containing protein [Clostridia bacterium]|nr:DUF1232 domain-containing protein [Clostridia bacterium]
MKKELSEQEALVELEKGYEKAEKILGNESKTERFLQRLEKKMKVIPIVGERLADIPVLASLVIHYFKREYTDLPIGTIIAVVSALIYFVSPLDIMPDILPGLGYVDDAAVVAACWNLVKSDVEEYLKWRDDNGKTLDL